MCILIIERDKRPTEASESRRVGKKEGGIESSSRESIRIPVLQLVLRKGASEKTPQGDYPQTVESDPGGSPGASCQEKW